MFAKLVFLCVALATVACVSSQSHHFEMGNKNVNDRQLHYEIVQKSSSILQIVTKDITWPGPGVNNATITYIKAYDQYTNGNGGYVSLLAGGVQQKFTTLHFKSQRGHGFNFLLEIWGF